MNGLTVAISAPGGRSGGFFLGLWWALVCVPPLTPQTVRAVSRLVGASDEAGDAVRRVIKAYHGSPHNFDRFDASKIGTGEGAQSYGHGLYFAGNERVADGYRSRLAGSYQHALAEPEDLDRYFAPGNVVDGYGGKDKVLEFMRGPDGPWDWRVRVVRADADGNPLPGERPRFHSTVPDRAVVDRFFGRAPRRPGHTYEVEIGYPEEALLDLDAPVLGQSQVIQAALGNYAEAPKWFSMGQEGWRGKNAYTRMASDLAAANPRIVDGYHVTHDQPAASAALLQAGVPGIRYLDQGSRSAGEGTRNYVVFPGAEDRIRILRKFGILAPMGAGMMGGEE